MDRSAVKEFVDITISSNDLKLYYKQGQRSGAYSYGQAGRRRLGTAYKNLHKQNIVLTFAAAQMDLQ
jgi:cell fate (sporulation/competence/biofilm development) regulator YlbF (YheA/YmcA/DUF963 family)